MAGSSAVVFPISAKHRRDAFSQLIEIHCRCAYEPFARQALTSGDGRGLAMTDCRSKKIPASREFAPTQEGPCGVARIAPRVAPGEPRGGRRPERPAQRRAHSKACA